MKKCYCICLFLGLHKGILGYMRPEKAVRSSKHEIS